MYFKYLFSLVFGFFVFFNISAFLPNILSGVINITLSTIVAIIGIYIAYFQYDYLKSKFLGKHPKLTTLLICAVLIMFIVLY